MNGVRSGPVNLFKVAGSIGVNSATLMIDSGASTEFIDTEFARRCGLTITPSACTIRLADGTVVPAHGQTTVTTLLTAAHGKPPISFTATFTVTSLKGYDAILGLSWLATHDVNVGWRNRTIELRTAGHPPRIVTPIECIGDAGAGLATLTVKDAESSVHR